ncbi:MAG: trehalose-phosphatase [Vicinamibacterales bacterium]
MTDHLFEKWATVARRVKRGDRLAIFTDFDGTLAHIRQHASHAHLSDRVRRALERLTADGHLVAVVSGRPLDDLQARVGIEGVWYAGSHGYFLRAPDGFELSLLRRDERRLLVRVAHRLTMAAGHLRGVLVEPKPGAIAVHFRAASPTSQRTVADVVSRLAGVHPGLRVFPGHMVWEILPAGPVDKYVAARFILRAARQRDSRSTAWPIYLGDDVSDERVFARWKGISVAVSRRPRTAARYFVRSPAEVADCLERLDDLYKTSRQRGDAAKAARIKPT